MKRVFQTTRKEARELLRRSLDALWELTPEGLLSPWYFRMSMPKATYDERKAEFRRQLGKRRKDFLRAQKLDEICASSDWLRTRVRRKTVDTRRNSYGYKHDVERWWRARGVGQYVSNGAFIVAAVGLGFTWRRYTTYHPNLMLGISRRGGSSDGV